MIGYFHYYPFIYDIMLPAQQQSIKNTSKINHNKYFQCFWTIYTCTDIFFLPPMPVGHLKRSISNNRTIRGWSERQIILFKAASTIIFIAPYKCVCSQKIGPWTTGDSVGLHSGSRSRCLQLPVRNKELTVLPYLRGNCTEMGNICLKWLLDVNVPVTVECFGSRSNYLLSKKRFPDALCGENLSPDPWFWGCVSGAWCVPGAHSHLLGASADAFLPPCRKQGCSFSLSTDVFNSRVSW